MKRDPLQAAKGPKVRRRGLLAGFGATALATSAVVFGKAGPAAAANYGCCNLVYAPSSYSACRAASNYTWYCQSTATRGCGCCEKKNSSGRIVASAYSCDRV